jgi:hypothetical protein
MTSLRLQQSAPYCVARHEPNRGSTQAHDKAERGRHHEPGCIMQRCSSSEERCSTLKEPQLESIRSSEDLVQTAKEVLAVLCSIVEEGQG